MKTSGNIFEVAASFALAAFDGSAGALYLSHNSELLLIADSDDAPTECRYVCRFPQSRELLAARLSYLHRVPRPHPSSILRAAIPA